MQHKCHMMWHNFHFKRMLITGLCQQTFVQISNAPFQQMHKIFILYILKGIFTYKIFLVEDKKDNNQVLMRKQDHLFEIANAQLFINLMFYIAQEQHILFIIKGIPFQYENDCGFFEKRIFFPLKILSFLLHGNWNAF